MKTTQTTPAQSLTQLEFSDADFQIAKEMAKRLGYSQTACTSTSALWGLYCLPENPRTAKPGEATRGGCIIRTRELGLLSIREGGCVMSATQQTMTDDFGHECAEVRVLPYGGGGNILCGRRGYETEMAFRRERIAEGVSFDLPVWENLTVYFPQPEGAK